MHNYTVHTSLQILCHVSAQGQKYIWSLIWYSLLGTLADPAGRAVYNVSLRPLGYRDRGFESR
jgi:hypothetical protein